MLVVWGHPGPHFVYLMLVVVDGVGTHIVTLMLVAGGNWEATFC